MEQEVLTIAVATVDKVKASMKAAAHGQPDATARFTFTSSEDLLRTLNANRWALLSTLAGAGPLGVRELAHRLARDVTGVHSDAGVLVNCGLIERTDAGALLLPYREVRVQFTAEAAPMTDVMPELDFIHAKRAKDVPALARIQRELIGKERVMIWLDAEVLAWFREQVKDGGDYTALINDTLRTAMDADSMRGGNTPRR